MGFLYDDKTVVAIKMETTSGTWNAPTPTSTSDCLQVLRGLKIDGMPSETKEIDSYAGSVVDKNATYPGKKMPKITFSTYLKVTDSVIDESNNDWYAIFSLFEIMAQNTMEYNIVENKLTWKFGEKMNERTASIAIYQDGHVYQFKGCKADLTIKCIAGENMVCDWTISGLFHGAATASLPTPSIWGNHYIVGKNHVSPGLTNETIESWEIAMGGKLEYIESASAVYGVAETFRDKYRFNIKFQSVPSAAARVSYYEVGDVLGVTLASDNALLPQLVFELTSGTEIDSYVSKRTTKADKGLLKIDTEVIGANIDGISLKFTSVVA